MAVIANSVSTVIGDMTGDNDGVIDGVLDPNGLPYRWQQNPDPAQLAMGASPRGDHAPTWFKNSGAVPSAYKDSDYWNAFTHWFVLFEEQGNTSANARVEVRNCEAYYLSKSTGNWVQILTTTNATAYKVTKDKLQWSGNLDADDKTTTAEGATSIRLRANQDYVYHGEWAHIRTNIAAFASDIDAIYCTMQARLVQHNTAQTLGNALWMVQAGADYWPEVETNVSEIGFTPGVGLSRSKRLTADWQSFNFATVQITRAEGTAPATDQYITQAEFTTNPPPGLSNVVAVSDWDNQLIGAPPAMTNPLIIVGKAGLEAWPAYHDPLPEPVPLYPAGDFYWTLGPPTIAADRDIIIDLRGETITKPIKVFNARHVWFVGGKIIATPVPGGGVGELGNTVSGQIVANKNLYPRVVGGNMIQVACSGTLRIEGVDIDCGGMNIDAVVGNINPGQTITDAAANKRFELVNCRFSGYRGHFKDDATWGEGLHADFFQYQSEPSSYLEILGENLVFDSGHQGLAGNCTGSERPGHFELRNVLGKIDQRYIDPDNERRQWPIFLSANTATFAFDEVYLPHPQGWAGSTDYINDIGYQNWWASEGNTYYTDPALAGAYTAAAGLNLYGGAIHLNTLGSPPANTDFAPADKVGIYYQSPWASLLGDPPVIPAPAPTPPPASAPSSLTKLVTFGGLKAALAGLSNNKNQAADTARSFLDNGKIQVKKAGIVVAQASAAVSQNSDDKLDIAPVTLTSTVAINPSDSDLEAHVTNASGTGGVKGPINGDVFRLTAPVAENGKLDFFSSSFDLDATGAFVVTPGSTTGDGSADGFTYGAPAEGFVYTPVVEPYTFKGAFEGHDFSAPLITPSNPVKISKQFVGMHTDGPALYDAVRLAFGTERSWDANQIAGPQASLTWAYVDKFVATGGARRWEGWDLWYDQHKDQGKLLIACPVLCPANINKYSPSHTKYPAFPFGSSAPTAAGLIQFKEFIAELCARYPQIAILEVWNEPHFNPASTALDGEDSRYNNTVHASANGFSGGSFYVGTPLDLADFTHAMREAAPARVKIAAPGWEGETNAGATNSIVRYIQALIQRGYLDDLDYRCTHHYTYGGDPQDTIPHIRSIKARYADGGAPNLPMINSENSAEDPVRIGDVSGQEQIKHIRRWLIGNAIEGMAACCLYKWGAYDILGNGPNQFSAGGPAYTPVVLESLQWALAELPGSTIYQAAFFSDNTYWIRYVKDGESTIKEARA